jgi:peptidoglycan/xylan/chitin deacetylase (PgdA/CDA1 family)
VSFPIITFHSIDDSDSVISLQPARFARIIQELADAGWRGCPVSEALSTWRAGDGRQRLVGLSFDDGYRNVLEQALPVMRDAGFRATVFAVAGRCGGDNRWPGQPSSIPRLELLDIDDLANLLEAGWEIGAHGLDHLTLTALAPARAERELREARSALEARLGTPTALFAYPYGVHDRTVRELARAVYDGACGTRLAMVKAADIADPFALPRIDAYYLRGFSPVKALDTVIGRGYLAVRRWARALRRHDAGDRAPATANTAGDNR